jgi:two-component system NarL family sensor kinase
VRELVAETRDNSASDTEILVDIRGFGGGVPDLPVAIEVGLYRIAQQALANILLHANARRVTIRLERNESRVRLRIEDDGNGFEPSAVPPNRFGLVGMGERAKLLGGRMTIETSSDVGTAVDVEIPLRTVNRFQRSGT